MITPAGWKPLLPLRGERGRPALPGAARQEPGRLAAAGHGADQLAVGGEALSGERGGSGSSLAIMANLGRLALENPSDADTEP